MTVKLLPFMSVWKEEHTVPINFNLVSTKTNQGACATPRQNVITVNQVLTVLVRALMLTGI